MSLVNANNSIFNSITITEPTWGEQLMLELNAWMINTPRARALVPVTADVFVFTYPLFLVVVYLYGIVNKARVWKVRALQVFASVVGTFGLNALIQLFGEKSRPEAAIANQERLILEHIPTDPFPSDHAAVSMTMAVSVLLIAYRSGNKCLKLAGRFFLVASVIMSLSRVMVAIHRPTDILVGWCTGTLIAVLVAWKPVSKFFESTVYAWAIWLEEWIVGLVWK
jgi:membrane-associated phospholipid phosphatase